MNYCIILAKKMIRDSSLRSEGQRMATMKRFTHVDADGRAQMGDVSAKPTSKSRAVAFGKIQLKPTTLELIAKDQIAKGNVFATARIAGIQAAKQTAHLIP